MEIETKTGLYVIPITREKWMRQTTTLKGEDLVFFVTRCNRANALTNLIKPVFGIDTDELFEKFRELEPNFNVETDYYAVRYTAQIKKEIDREKIRQDIKHIQDSVDKMEFKGNIRYNLTTRDKIADYIVKLLEDNN